MTLRGDGIDRGKGWLEDGVGKDPHSELADRRPSSHQNFIVITIIPAAIPIPSLPTLPNLQLQILVYESSTYAHQDLITSHPIPPTPTPINNPPTQKQRLPSNSNLLIHNINKLRDFYSSADKSKLGY